MFFGLDIMMIYFVGFLFFLFFVVLNSSYLFIIGGVILFSVVIFLCMMWNGFVLFGLIFMMVYSGGMLLLILYVSAMLGDYEVEGVPKMNFFVFMFCMVFFNLGLYEAFHFFGSFTHYTYGGLYLFFCTACLGLSLVSILNLLLQKNY
uniref:NADH dehydrogenase subunit 6 n=1 Tax=Botrylloides nigrum TaxID=1256663 RepID=S0DFE6_9ASCI|nr:NADH dehydrogenase subunit 6 [Botrylloides nigrum]CCO25786.1 NADH dehydrogenase subunit 6 [Botrylloides nigrum]